MIAGRASDDCRSLHLGDGFSFNSGNETAARYDTYDSPFFRTDGFYGNNGAGFATNFYANQWNISPAAAPEPETIVQLVAGLLIIAGKYTRKKKAA